MNHLDEFQLNEYLDGGLNEAEKQALETHLAVCDGCQQALAELQAVFLALDEVGETVLTTDLSARVLAEWQAQAQPESNGWLRPLLFIQLAGAIGMVAWLWPVIWGWLVGVETAVQQYQADWGQKLASLSFLWQQSGQWWATSWQQIYLVRPSISLETGQWTILIALVLIGWVLSNRWLMSNE